MPASRDQFLTDVARALRASHGDAEGEALVRPLEPWLDMPWPFPPGRGGEAPSPRASVAAAELAVVDAFPDRAGDLLVPLARIAAAAALAEAVTWESVTTSHSDAPIVPFRTVNDEPVEFQCPELAFHQGSEEEREELLRELLAERAASLIRRRVRLRTRTLAGGRILVTRLTSGGTAELPLSANWVEETAVGATLDRPGIPVRVLVSWMPTTHIAAVSEALARGAPHAWSEDAETRWGWRPGWIR